MSVFHASLAGNIGQPAKVGPAPATPPSGPRAGGDSATPASGTMGGGGAARKGAPPRVHAQRATSKKKRRIIRLKPSERPLSTRPQGVGAAARPRADQAVRRAVVFFLPKIQAPSTPSS